MVYYPSLIDTDTTLPPVRDGQPVSGSVVEKLRTTIIDIEKELGVKPSGTYSTVKGRLDALETLVGNLEIITLANDLGGTLTNPKVIGLQGRPISTEAPSLGEVLVWNGVAWVPAPGPSAEINFRLYNDGTPVAENVTGINVIGNGTFSASGFGGDLTITGGSGLPAFDQPYDYLRAIPTPAFTNPMEICADGNYLWVANWRSNKIQKIDKSVSPSVITNFTINGVDGNYQIKSTNNYIIVIGGGTQFGTDAFDDCTINILDKNTGEVLGFVQPFPKDPDYGVSFGWIHGITIDNDNLYVSSDTSIYKYSIDAIVSAYPSAGISIVDNDVPGLHGTLPGPNNNRLLFANNQLFMVTGYGSGVYEINQTDLSVVQSYTDFYDPIGASAFTLDLEFANGRLWIATRKYTGGIHQFDPNDLASGPITSLDIDHNIYRIVKDNSSFIYAKSNNGQISKIYIDDTPVVVTTGTVPGSSDDGYSGVVYDGYNLWAVVFDQNIVLKISTDTLTVLDIIEGDLAAKFTRGDVIFDGAAAKTNLRSNRILQSRIDNTKSGIVNLSTDTTNGFQTGAFGNYVTIVGGDQNTAHGDYNTVVGGFANGMTSSETTPSYSFVGGGQQNIINGGSSYNVIVGGNSNGLTETTASFVGGGQSNGISLGGNSSIIGGNSNFMNASSNATIVGGDTNSIVSGSGSIILGGINNQVDNAINTTIMGRDAVAIHCGEMVHSGGAFINQGDAQWGRYFVKGTGSNLDPVILTDAVGNEFLLKPGNAYAIRATLLCHKTNGPGGIAVLIYRVIAYHGGSDATIIAQTLIEDNSFGHTYSLVFSAENQSIRATFTGESGQTVRAFLTYEYSQLNGSLDFGG